MKAITVGDIAHALELVAPLTMQESYDNAGLQCGDPRCQVTRVLTCLDIDEQTVMEAHAQGCQMVVSHHPLLFRAIKCIDPTRDYISRTLMAAVRHGIALYAAHTNLDNAPGGVNTRLAEVLALGDTQPLTRLSATNARGETLNGGSGMIGTLPHPMTAAQLLEYLQQRLSAPRLASNLRDVADADRPITRLALCGGAGADFIGEARRLGAQAYLTGEVRYHEFFGHGDMLLVEAGHYETEQHTVALLRDIITEAFPSGIDVIMTSRPANPRVIY